LNGTSITYGCERGHGFLDMIREFLSEEGYEVIVMHESQAAFEVILERKPRLVIIELLISNPEAGLMVLNKMRLHPETTHIPVVLASTTTRLLRDKKRISGRKAVTCSRSPLI
jgi:CheY-like chemotaxis protein